MEDLIKDYIIEYLYNEIDYYEHCISQLKNVIDKVNNKEIKI